MRLLVLRPEPGASATAARARTLGLEPVVAPLFAVVPLDHEPPDAALYDSVLLTSANGARFGSSGLTDLPCFAVGEATAAAARESGFASVATGASDAAEAVEMLAGSGSRRAIHPCGREHLRTEHALVRIEHRPVYAAEPLPVRPDLFSKPVVALVHSPRAARRLADLVGSRSAIAVAAISAAAAEAAGEGWRALAVAQAPRDDALLELAAKLCHDSALWAEEDHGI